MFSKAITPILLLIGAIIVLLFFVKTYEGFDGTVPTNPDTSSIPVATPGATTPDPTAAHPSAKDIEALIARLRDVKAEYEKNPEFNGIPADKKTELSAFKPKIPTFEQRLNELLADPTKINMNDFMNMAMEIDRPGIILQRPAPGPVDPVSPVGPSGSAGQVGPVGPLGPVGSFGLNIVEIETTLSALHNLKTLMLRKDPMKTNLPIDVRNNLVMLRPQLPALENKYNAALADPKSSSLTIEQVLEDRKRFKSYMNQLEGAITNTELEKLRVESAKKAQEEYSQVVNANAAEAKETTVAGSVGIITKQQLTNLQTRIRGEIRRIENLRSRSATMITRKAQLEKMLADVTDIISSVDRKALKLEDVPIRPSDADSFLKSLASGKSLPTLIVPKPKTPDSIQAKGAAFPTMTPQIQQLLEQAKHLKWDLEVKLSYDPKLEIQDRSIKLLESLEKKLTAAAISDTPIPPQLHAEYMNQLGQLQASLDKKSSKSKPSGSANGRLPSTYSRTMNAPNAEYPDHTKLLEAQGAQSGPNSRFPDGEISPDVYIRPGFVMNDATIARRASSSAFDPSVVGGPDYKKRALDLCRQVESAGLGDPASFGCIENPDAVSSSYSWKGNHQMVCNRLGDTWGSWYPEMFGCPKYDPTDKFRGTML